MFHFVYRKLITSTVIRSRITATIQSHDYLRFISTQNSDFTVEYLRNSCGLSPALALRVSKNIVLDKSTITRADSVLSLFKSYGLTQSHISKLIATRPRLLLASPEKTLKPKLEYYNNISISGPILGKLFCKNEAYLMGSLEKHIIPSINFLRSFVHTDDDIPVILYRLSWLYNIESHMGPNIKILLDHGMPKCNISKLMTCNPRTLSLGPDKLSNIVLELKKMGFCPSSKVFVIGVHVLWGMKKSTWDAKLEAYKSFGWSEDEVISIFKKQPSVMAISVKNINSALDFFTNNLNMTRTEISKYATIILLSMEKRIIPRTLVLQPLLSKELINKNSLGPAYTVVEREFLKRFVIKYQNEVPELLKLYQGKISKEFVVGQKEGLEVEKF